MAGGGAGERGGGRGRGRGSASRARPGSSRVTFGKGRKKVEARGAAGNLEAHSEPLTIQGEQEEEDEELPATPPDYDPSAVSLTIYPTNAAVRSYQLNLTMAALMENTLISLPTGLGKTFIASVVMYNFNRWFPNSYIVFLAPTRPLVAQQIKACSEIVGIDSKLMVELTGQIIPKKREELWKENKVFFLTPQVLVSDLKKGTCDAGKIRCVIIDEAHKATGEHAYVQVVREVRKKNKLFRIVGLSATPGSDLFSVGQVLRNLKISNIQIRTETSPDVLPYIQEKKVDTVVVKLGSVLEEVQARLIEVYQHYVGKLLRNNALSWRGDVANLGQFQLLRARDNYRLTLAQNLPNYVKSYVELDYATCISLAHSLELLTFYGLRSFYEFVKGILNKEKSNAAVCAELTKNAEFSKILKELEEKYGIEGSANASRSKLFTSFNNSKDKEASFSTSVVLPQDKLDTTSHPKLEKLKEIVIKHFKKYEYQEEGTRVMIFSQYRSSATEITTLLSNLSPNIKPMVFYGQASSSSKGFKQREQVEVVDRFRKGGYNVLVCTSVGEEGLDIGEVDLIICFDASRSPTRLVQRMGRTGRKRDGRIVFLLGEGKEERNYNASCNLSSNVSKTIEDPSRLQPFLYKNSPRMIPKDVMPQLFKMNIILTSEQKQSGSPISRPVTATSTVSRKSRSPSPFPQHEEPAMSPGRVMTSIMEDIFDVRQPSEVETNRCINVPKPKRIEWTKDYNELDDDDILLKSADLDLFFGKFRTTRNFYKNCCGCGNGFGERSSTSKVEASVPLPKPDFGDLSKISELDPEPDPFEDDYGWVFDALPAEVYELPKKVPIANAEPPFETEIVRSSGRVDNPPSSSAIKPTPTVKTSEETSADPLPKPYVFTFKKKEPPATAPKVKSLKPSLALSPLPLSITPVKAPPPIVSLISPTSSTTSNEEQFADFHCSGSSTTSNEEQFTGHQTTNQLLRMQNVPTVISRCTESVVAVTKLNSEQEQLQLEEDLFKDDMLLFEEDEEESAVDVVGVEQVPQVNVGSEEENKERGGYFKLPSPVPSPPRIFNRTFGKADDEKSKSLFGADDYGSGENAVGSLLRSPSPVKKSSYHPLSPVARPLISISPPIRRERSAAVSTSMTRNGVSSTSTSTGSGWIEPGASTFRGKNTQSQGKFKKPLPAPARSVLHASVNYDDEDDDDFLPTQKKKPSFVFQPPAKPKKQKPKIYASSPLKPFTTLNRPAFPDISPVARKEEKKKRRRRRSGGQGFLEVEAEVSGSESDEDDEDEDMELDEYDRSFVDDEDGSDLITDTQQVRYIRSVKDAPLGNLKFKIPERRESPQRNVKSFEGDEEDHEADYEGDSFCVENSEAVEFAEEGVFTQAMNLAREEVAKENLLSNKRRKTRGQARKEIIKRRRRILMEDSDED